MMLCKMVTCCSGPELVRWSGAPNYPSNGWMLMPSAFAPSFLFVALYFFCLLKPT
jgi:hypothetical protein